LFEGDVLEDNEEEEEEEEEEEVVDVVWEMEKSVEKGLCMC